MHFICPSTIPYNDRGPSTHLICHIVQGEETASNYLLLSDDGMEGGSCVVPAGATWAVRVNGTEVSSILFPLQVEMSPWNESRPKALQGGERCVVTGTI